MSALIEQVLQGKEAIISKAGKLVVKPIPYNADTTSRQLGVGSWGGKIWVADDFDDLPEEPHQEYPSRRRRLECDNLPPH